MITSEEAIEKLDKIYLDNDFGKYSTASEGICKIFQAICPSLAEDIEEMYFCFASPAIVRGEGNFGSVFPMKLPFRIYIGNLSPLKVASCVSALNCRNTRGVEQIESFVNFLTAFDEQTRTDPPEKRQLQILFDWFAENVSDRVYRTPVKTKNGNWEMWKWKTPITKKGRKETFEKACIPEGFSLKDLTAHILTTGKLPPASRNKFGLTNNAMERD